MDHTEATCNDVQSSQLNQTCLKGVRQITMRAVLALLALCTAARRSPVPLRLVVVPRGGGDDGDEAAVVEAAPRDVVEAPEDMDGEVYLDVHFDPLKALASAAKAARGVLVRAFASLFGGGGASGRGGSPDAPSAVEAACPGALATAARAAKRALATGRPVLVVAAPPASKAAEALAAAVKVLGGGDAVVVLDATRTAQTYARAARLASVAIPAALPKHAPFCALAVPTGDGQLRYVAVYRGTGVGESWLARARETAADDLAALERAAVEHRLASEQKRELAQAKSSDRRSATDAATARAAAAAAAAAEAEATLTAERRAAADLTRRAALEKALAPEPDGPGVLVKLRCPDGSTATRKFASDAPAGALLDWCDVRGVDLDAFVVRKAVGDRDRLEDRTSLLGDVLGTRALLECVAR